MTELVDGSGSMVASIVLPLGGAILAALLPRGAAAVGLVTGLLTACAVLGVVLRVFGGGQVAVEVGGWAAPLGIRLATDGLSALLLAMTAVVGIGVSVYARFYFAGSHEVARFFWPLWLFLWAALDALYQSNDVFNLYVTLELAGLSAVALVALTGRARLWSAPCATCSCRSSERSPTCSASPSCITHMGFSISDGSPSTHGPARSSPCRSP